MMFGNVISCYLKVLCSDEEFQKRHKWAAENEEAKDQCLVQDENIRRKCDVSLLQDTSQTCTVQSTVSANRICEKV